MGSPQRRQRPRSRSHESTGTLSYGAIGAPQPGQRERGRTSDSPRGRRWITTFRKLPMSAPRTPASATAAAMATAPGSRRGSLLAAGDVSPGVLDDAGAAVRRDARERAVEVVQVHAVRPDV